MDICFHLLWVNTKEFNCWISWLGYIRWFCKNCLAKCLDHFAALAVVRKCSSCSISVPAFGVVSVLNFVHSNTHVVVFLYFLTFLNSFYVLKNFICKLDFVDSVSRTGFWIFFLVFCFCSNWNELLFCSKQRWHILFLIWSPFTFYWFIRSAFLRWVSQLTSIVRIYAI